MRIRNWAAAVVVMAGAAVAGCQSDGGGGDAMAAGEPVAVQVGQTVYRLEGGRAGMVKAYSVNGGPAEKVCSACADATKAYATTGELEMKCTSCGASRMSLGGRAQ